ncbi:MAG: DUF1284 domain-containing protein [Pseudomonadota bacterium]
MRLRGHHLICLHFYHGEGYDAEFVSHLSVLLGRAEIGEAVLVVEGPDEVCGICPWFNGQICEHSAGAEAEIRDMDATAMRLLNVAPGDSVAWPALQEHLPEILSPWRERYCRSCGWQAACRKGGLAGL